MSKIVKLILLLTLLLVVVVSAGESRDLDFSEQSSQAVFVFEGDELRFELLDGTHSLIIEEVVSSSSVKFDIVPFFDTENTRAWPGFVSLDTIMRVDLDKDGADDIYVALYGVDEETGEVHLVVQDRSNREDGDDDIGVVDGDAPSSDEGWNKNYILALVAIAILLILGFMYSRKGDKEEGSSSESKDDEVVDAAVVHKEEIKVEEPVVEEESVAVEEVKEAEEAMEDQAPAESFEEKGSKHMSVEEIEAAEEESSTSDRL
tara:strand:+ start:2501 stop:3283 length:783 start_codon:yes stop_codon:yes gene_type:complete